MRSFVSWIRSFAQPSAKPSNPPAGYKRLVFRKGMSAIQYTCLNGDKYDSTADLLSDLDLSLFHSEYVNLDKTINYAGGILATGDYWGIVGYRNTGMRVIMVFKIDVDPDKVSSYKKLTEDMVTLPSTISNPNNGGKFIIKYVQVHGGGRKWDYSHGCLTILNYGGTYEFDRLLEKLDDNEIVKITVM